MRAPVSSLPRLSVNPGQDAGAWRELLLYGNPGLTNSATNKRTELSSAIEGGSGLERWLPRLNHRQAASFVGM
eukprot:CAMPEP_0171488522 /NCGR_PEP_ID=MMETSP0958-20121227/2249_1 /TAXON_ID=87120 /ORGANISM="Aurantiochytrium limacinum, Strain ATCCMYA-1381" /LENGTH=72 /DNA_ID=CAMNT_0012021635 /DNA_START=523 /DNA_END=741 /DNA_ORIENTATION=-